MEKKIKKLATDWLEIINKFNKKINSNYFKWDSNNEKICTIPPFIKIENQNSDVLNNFLKITYCNLLNLIDLINNLLIKSEENIFDLKFEIEKNFKLDNKVRRKKIFSKTFFKKNATSRDFQSMGSYFFSLMNILIIDFYIESNKKGKSHKFIKFERIFFKQKEYFMTIFLLLNNILENIKFFLIFVNNIVLFFNDSNSFAKKIKDMNKIDKKNFGNNWIETFKINIGLFSCNHEYFLNKNIEEGNIPKDIKEIKKYIFKDYDDDSIFLKLRQSMYAHTCSFFNDYDPSKREYMTSVFFSGKQFLLLGSYFCKEKVMILVVMILLIFLWKLCLITKIPFFLTL